VLGGFKALAFMRGVMNSTAIMTKTCRGSC